jgi:hypothetical protein
VFWNGAYYSTRGGVWLIQVTPRLQGRALNWAGTHSSLTSSPVQSSPVNCCWPFQQSRSWFQAPSGPMTIFLFFARLLRVLKRGGGLTTTGHPSTGGDSTAHTHTLSLTHPDWLTLTLSTHCNQVTSLVCARYIASGRTAQKTPSPTIILLLRVYSLPSNGSFVWWRRASVYCAMASNGWRLLLSYSVMSQYYPSSLGVGAEKPTVTSSLQVEFLARDLPYTNEYYLLHGDIRLCIVSLDRAHQNVISSFAWGPQVCTVYMCDPLKLRLPAVHKVRYS